MKEDTLKFFRGLRAVREFTTEPVSDDDLSQILEVGRWSSSGGNRQSSEVVVVRDRSLLEKFAEWGARPAANAAVSLLLVSQDQPAVFVEGRMAERLALAVRACGLGSVIATLKEDGPDKAKQQLGIPAEVRAVALVNIGHTDVEARKTLPKKGATARKPMEQYAHRDRYYSMWRSVVARASVEPGRNRQLGVRAERRQQRGPGAALPACCRVGARLVPANGDLPDQQCGRDQELGARGDGAMFGHQEMMGGGDPLPFGLEANRPTFPALIDYAYSQSIIPTKTAPGVGAGAQCPGTLRSPHDH